MTTRVLHVYIVGDNNFTIIDDAGNLADRLCWDEMVGSIAESTHPLVGLNRARYMMTPTEWEWRRDRWRIRAINEIR